MQGAGAKAGVENISLAQCITHNVAVSCCRDHGMCGWEGSQALPGQVGLSGTEEHTPAPPSVSMERPELSPTCQVSHQQHSRVMKAAQALWRRSWFIHIPVNCFFCNVFSLLLYWLYQLLFCSKFLWALWASRRRQKTALSTSWNLQKCLTRLQLSENLCLSGSPQPWVWATHAVLQQHSAGARSLWGCSRVVKNCSSFEKGMWTEAQWYRSSYRHSELHLSRVIKIIIWIERVL